MQKTCNLRFCTFLEELGRELHLTGRFIWFCEFFWDEITIILLIKVWHEKANTKNASVSRMTKATPLQTSLPSVQKRQKEGNHRKLNRLKAC